MAWIRLARVFQRIDRGSAEELRRADVSLAQFDVLAQVGAREGLTQQALADRLLVTKGNVCQILDRLETRGWIERRPVPGSRANALFLTGEGWRVRDAVLPGHEERIAARFDALSDDEVATLASLLRRVDRSLDRDQQQGEKK